MHRLCFTTSDTAIPTYIVDAGNLLQFEVPSFKRVFHPSRRQEKHAPTVVSGSTGERGKVFCVWLCSPVPRVAGK